jgi:acetyl-CoA carboxylase beta subunit
METAKHTLTAADRCDRCGAQAYAKTIHEDDMELLWCAHHWRLHADKATPYLVYLDPAMPTQDGVKEHAT